MEVAPPSYSANEPAIHRLVDDILAYIFLLNATIPEHATTMASSQVCTRWRSIAVNCHTIWGRIIDYPQHSLKWIETLLDRSNPSSLDFGSRLYKVYFANGGQSVLDLVFNHIDRLRIFNLQIPASSWELVRSRFLQLPAPNLEFVHVVIDGDIAAAGHLAHPSGLFENHAPNLQSLGLTFCSIDFTSPVLTPLTELYVYNDVKIGSPTVLEWLNILGEMPSLRWVTLIRAISSSPASDISSCPVVHLRALDMLSVDGPLHESVILVDHLIVPPRCGLRFCGYDAHIAGLDQRRLWAIIEKKMDLWARNAPNRHLEASNIFYGWDDSYHVTIGNLKLPFPCGGPRTPWSTEAVEVEKGLCTSGSGVDPVLSITLQIADIQMPVPLFLSLFALFEWTFFDTTYLQLRIGCGPELFLALFDSFRRFVNLETLSLGYYIATDFPFPLLQQTNSVIFPALKSIELFRGDFQNGPESLLPVANFLQWRKKQGFPVPKIETVRDPECPDNDDTEYIRDILACLQDRVGEINE